MRMCACVAWAIRDFSLKFEEQIDNKQAQTETKSFHGKKERKKERMKER